jgi:hypothetical protein
MESLYDLAIESPADALADFEVPPFRAALQRSDL